MNDLLIKCSNDKCDNIIRAHYKIHDQILHCTKCGSYVQFLNSTDLVCKHCSNILIYPLNMNSPMVQCRKCNAKYTMIKGGAVAASKSPDAFHGVLECPLDSVAGLEQEVTIAKMAFDKIRAKGASLGQQDPGKIIYINQIDVRLANMKAEFSVYPIEYLRCLHTTCNKPFYDGHPIIKYYGPVYGYIWCGLFNSLVYNKGIREIWVKDRVLYNTLMEVPAFHEHKNRIKIFSEI